MLIVNPNEMTIGIILLATAVQILNIRNFFLEKAPQVIRQCCFKSREVFLQMWIAFVRYSQCKELTLDTVSTILTI